MKRRIYKYALPFSAVDRTVQVTVPMFATCLSIGLQNDVVMVWLSFSPFENRTESRTFRLIATGEDFEREQGDEFIGTLHHDDGFVAHIFESRWHKKDLRATGCLETATSCIKCGVPFALPKLQRERCYEDGGFYYCPNGHSQGWDKRNSKSYTDKLEAEIAALQSNLSYKDTQIEAAKRSTSAVRGQLTKLEKRVANGVCPCCQRSFANVHRHIKTKHPDYATVE